MKARKKKILFITQQLPYPPDSGGKIKTYETLRLLARNHGIHLVCFTDSKKKIQFSGGVEKFCSTVKVFIWPLTTAGFKMIKRLVFFNLFSLTPFTVHRYFSPEAKSYVEDLLKKEAFDVIWIDHDNMVQYLPRRKEHLWVLESHDIEYEAALRIALKEKSLIYKIFFLIESLKLYLHEKRVTPLFDYCLAISQGDKNHLIKLGARPPKTFVFPVPTKVDSKFDFHKRRKKILFIGLLSWWPNKDGLKWFYREIFPLIRKRISRTTVLVVGADERYVKKIVPRNEKNVIFAGYVDDIEPFLKEADVFIVPLRLGGGIRIKILTAMAAGIPTVSTTIGSEGIPARDGKEIIIADRTEQFASSVTRVLEDKMLANRLSKKGLEFIRKNYNQKKTMNILERVFSD